MVVICRDSVPQAGMVKTPIRCVSKANALTDTHAGAAELCWMNRALRDEVGEEMWQLDTPLAL